MIQPHHLDLPSKFTHFRLNNYFSQLKVIERMATVEERFRISCAPPGTGKSVINISISQLLDQGRVLYLTPNKTLQSQIVSEFSSMGMFFLEGHSSYPCMKGKFGIESCSRSKYKDCQYWLDVKESLNHRFVTTNIANWISIKLSEDSGRFGNFGVLILDEAHNTEKILCDCLAITISKPKVFDLISRRVPDSLEITEWISWAIDNLSICERLLHKSISSDEKLDHISQRTIDLSELFTIMSRVSSIQKNVIWVVEEISLDTRKLTPVFASDYAEDYLFRGIKTIILSSATITRQYMDNLGIKSFYFEDVNSGFNPERKPFYYWPIMDIDYRTMAVEGLQIRVAARFDDFFEDRLPDRGLLHTAAYKYSDMIYRHSRLKDFMSNHDSRSAREKIELFTNEKGNPILLSPIAFEGLDLFGPKARYQGILKVPTEDARNPVIKERKKRYPLYVKQIAQQKILQSDGRIMRYDDDYGETLIIDKYFGRLLKELEWPRYFMNALKVVDRCPQPISF